MSQQVVVEQIEVGNVISFTLFQQKLSKNFMAISSRLRKLQGLFDLQSKVKALQKAQNFLTMKVDTIVQKLPKDGSVTRKDVRTIAKQLMFDVFNSQQQKLKTCKFTMDIQAQFQKLRSDLQRKGAGGTSRDDKDIKQGSRTSFTAGQILRETQKEKEKVKNVVPRESLQQCLDQNEMAMVNDIVQGENKENGKEKQEKNSEVTQLIQKVQQLGRIVAQLRLGKGYATFLQQQAQRMSKFQQYEQKSRQTARKHKEKPIQLQGIKAQNIKGQVLRRQLLSQVQKMQLNKQQMARQQLMQKKTTYNQAFVMGVSQPKQIKQVKQFKQGSGFKRSYSIKKLDKLQRRLRVDDLKDLNSVLRQIQLRIQTKVSHDIFMGFVKDFQQKLQVLRLTKDASADLNDMRKTIYIMQSKLQSVIGYLQSLAQEDEALLVRKQWTCVSCDKGLEKYQGRVGQHLSWESISSKKISPTKAGAFGHTGQLAAKIKNLMDKSDQ